MNRIKLLIAPLALLMMSSCGNNEEIEQLQSINEELKMEIRDRDEAVSDLIGGLESIQLDMRDITRREQLLDGLTVNESELAQSPQQKIIEDIALVDGLIRRNQEKIESLEMKLKSSDGKLYEFERVISNLKLDLLDKEKEIEVFKNSLIELEEGYADLFDEYHEQLLISSMQDEELHKAYFAYGSKKELEEMHVAEKEGGVLGMGTTWKLKNDFNKDYFTELDIREVSRLPLESKKVELISSHPEDSYELVMERDQVKEILITDPDAFWSGSKYLTVAVE
ncbi:MAG: hypothetical protein HKN45_05170 [Flavobacteriales bacterium]|nr:hypothetical protein [Flavobacteriales bacterium]NNK81132.1 hypothetical protein [Flavobacteriales bacterium]